MNARNEKHVCNGTMKKKSLELFARYGVEPRSGESQVFHPAYGCTTVVTPLQFALYETAIKAMDVHYQALIRIGFEPPAGTLAFGPGQQAANERTDLRVYRKLGGELESGSRQAKRVDGQQR